MLGSPGADRVIGRSTRIDVEGLAALALELEHEGLDWLLVDCPPRMDEWGWAGLRICSEVLIPVQAEFFAMHGLSQMLATLREAEAEYPGRAALMGVLVTLLDPKESVSSEVVSDLRSNLGPRVFTSQILRDSGFIEAASHGISLLSYNPGAVGALCYAELVREVLDG